MIDTNSQITEENDVAKGRNKLIAAICDELFTSGYQDGRKATRLQLKGPNEEDLGGWCRDAVEKVLKKHLAAAETKESTGK